MMASTPETFLFHFNCPNLRSLLTLYLNLTVESSSNKENQSLFHKKVFKCRELIFIEQTLVATPEIPGADVTVIVPVIRLKSQDFQMKLEKLQLRIIKLDQTSPQIFQECLHYTVVSKLAPSWNKVNNLLLQVLDTFVSNDETTLCIKPLCIKMPLMKLEDYGGWEMLNKFSIVRLDEHCSVLPSLKRAKVLSLSKHIGRNSSFKNYEELRKHWKNMYGYRLPDLPESSICYVNVIFPFPSSPIYTYPIFCVRPFGVIEIPWINPKDTLQLFLEDFFKRVGSICGEKCQLLDFKASFPILQLHAASDITEDMKPRAGSTYSKTSSIPYRNFPIITPTHEHANVNVIKGMPYRRDMKEMENTKNEKEASLEQPSKSEAFVAKNMPKKIDEFDPAPLEVRSISSDISVRYEAKPNENINPSASKVLEPINQPRYAPHFEPKTPAMKQVKLTTVFPETKGKRYVPTFVAKKSKQIPSMNNTITVLKSNNAVNESEQRSKEKSQVPQFKKCKMNSDCSIESTKNGLNEQKKCSKTKKEKCIRKPNKK